MASFSVADLKAAVEAEIEATRVAWEADHAERLEKFQASEAAWMETYGPMWLEVLPKLRAKLRRGQPLYWEDFPGRDRYSAGRAVAIGDRRQVPTLGDFRPPYELVNLLNVLNAIGDEFITAAGLNRIGVTPSALRQALQRLGRLNRAV